ncbi:MAG: AMP-binding protein, partial [bacterium]|nr:AMP-binding protein [bacterium]
VKKRTLKAFENQDYQFEDLVEKVNSSWDVSRNPLFDTMLVLQNTGLTRLEIPGLNLKPREFENRTSKFDLTFQGEEKGDHLLCTLEYASKLFKEDTIERFIAYYRKIISKVTANPSITVAEIDILSETEREQVLVEFNDTGTDYPGDKTIHELFEEQVVKTPDRIAVASTGAKPFHEETSQRNPGGPGTTTGQSFTQLTYRELNINANRLAGSLSKKGISHGSIIAIMVEPSLEMIIALLGILKTGSAYLPVNPDYPEERKKYMLNDSGAKALLTQKQIRKDMSTCSEETLPPGISAGPGDLAYIMYTSGTTGKAKGVMVEHRSVVRLVIN